MQFPTTLATANTLLRSLFVMASLLSDYTLKYDEWIVTRPSFDGHTSVERKRWIAILKTSLTYAIAEPLWYFLMTAVTNQAPWAFLMACLMHILAIPGVIILMGECVMKTMERHKEVCGDAEALAKEEEGEANDESQKSDLPSAEKDGKTAPKVDLRPCMDRHPMPMTYSLAPLWTVATAAMSNAAMLFFTRYLCSQDSQTWFDHFAFGWIVITLLCACFFVFSRWNNKMIYETCRRPMYSWAAPWDVLKYRLVALFLMVLVRGFVRDLLSQDPFTWFTYSIENGIYLLGAVDTSDGPGTSPGPKKHLMDRMLAAVPPWVGSTISIVNCFCVLGYAWHSRRRRQQEERAEQQQRAE